MNNNKSIKNDFKKRLSYKRYRKMRSHLNELRAFISENLGAFENMIESGMEEEQERQRKSDKKRKNNKEDNKKRRSDKEK